MRYFLLFFCLVLTLSGCSYTTPSYSVDPDTVMLVRSLGVQGITVGNFEAPPELDLICRGAGTLFLTNGLTHTSYIQKALQDELKIAGAYTNTAPRITLTGKVLKIKFNSGYGLTDGSWDLELLLNSSNGKSMTVAEHFEYVTGLGSDTVCLQTAQAFMPAVQSLIRRAVSSAEFKALTSN